VNAHVAQLLVGDGNPESNRTWSEHLMVRSGAAMQRRLKLVQLKGRADLEELAMLKSPSLLVMVLGPFLGGKES
jgi:hypothetical protein